ncbi:EH signature domain-containing protein [Vogesella indigofera]|uniref:EH signature domain-containing protein n=1 Tax=Vogesella indigofera TaxID=45465 RepID=UPI00234EC437|nr:EH signature domain-containing protein [Vogesella indigofera]MDC7698326.1 EH signature domain-containing protein [Vogesella indigofera]
MQQILLKLENSLSLTLQRLGLASADAQSPLRPFSAMEQAANVVNQRFDFGAPPIPPLAQRQAAIVKFLTQVPLTIRDWRLVCYGLTDDTGDGVCLLEMAQPFETLIMHLSKEIRSGYLRRKSWFGLVSSYFAFKGQYRESNGQWRKLRQLIISGFQQLELAQTGPRNWISTVQKHGAIFGENPATHLAEMLVYDRVAELQQLKSTLQIPEHCWLWEQLMTDLAAIIKSMPEAQFLQKIDALLELTEVYPRYADFIFASILRRYAKGECREVTHQHLKDIGLDRWGSPQINSKKNLWLHHAGDDVVKMILRWFAKDDLEHFFKLLQGESQVDQRRLDYWLRFVGQMAFTRIALGTQAYLDSRTDFVEFRQKNQGRVAQLKGSGHINAFMMQIGEYLFVEFSGTGNALYFYEKDNIPFGIDSSHYNLNVELKRTIYLSKLKSYENSLSHRGEWQFKADSLLAKLGIYPDGKESPARSLSRYFHQENSRQSSDSRAASPLKISSVSQSPDYSRRVNSVISAVREELRQNGLSLPEEDLRSKGGAYWFVTSARLPLIDKKLSSWGLKYADRGYWIK